MTDKKTLEQQLETLQAKMKIVKARIAQREARLRTKGSVKQRKIEARRKIIVGGYVLASYRGQKEPLIAYLKMIASAEGMRDTERKVIVDWIAELRPGE